MLTMTLSLGGIERILTSPLQMGPHGWRLRTAIWGAGSLSGRRLHQRVP